MQGLRDEGKILDVISKEVAQSNESPNLALAGWGRHVAVNSQFSFSWTNSLRRQHESQVGNFGVAKEAFGQVDFEVVVLQLLEDLVKNLKVMFVGSHVDDDVVDVDNDVFDLDEHLFH